jgi:uncharacterized protein YndB with AHSA1/START domain
MDENLIFKALADESRRKLLDLLFQQDGQTLSELQVHLPMTRFGCMKHLQILEEAGLLTTRKIGREKYHYLNPIPIQQIYNRWVSKYAQPWTHTLLNLKSSLEENTMTQKPNHIYEVFIRTTPEKLWQALTDGQITPHYYFGSQVQSAWEVGNSYTYSMPDGSLMIEGEVLEINPPHKLITTFRPLWQPDAKTLPTSKVTWQIEPMGAVCKLTLIHDDLDSEHAMAQGIITGWAQILSSLKTLLETGEPLVIAS